MTIELSEYVIDAIADAVVKKMQEPSYKSIKTELSGDAISRQAALGCCRNEWEEEVEMRLKALPPVTPQPKMGRWIMSDDGLYRPICNNCGAHPWKGYIPTVEEATNVFKFCPNCGAKMQEVKND